MTTRILIYTGMLFIFSSLQSMEIIKKIKRKHITKDEHTNIITKEFFTTQRFLDKNMLKKDIIPQIRQYCILLRNKDFEKDELFAEKWNDFNIPLKFYPLLTLTQKQCLRCMLLSLFSASFNENGPSEIYYLLQSNKQYNQFITLPIELRKCLTIFPKSALTKQIIPYPSTPVNPEETIQVKTANHPNDSRFYNSIPQPIIPEECKKKKQKK